MTNRIITIALALAFINVLPVQGSDRHQSVSVIFSIDGKRIACHALRVRLILDGQTMLAKGTPNGFIVPDAFDKKPSEWLDSQKVGIRVSCDAYVLDFEEHPSWVSSGTWEVGIAYPPYWKRFGFSEAGTWLSYLVSECDGCDPGVVHTISQTNPPESLVLQLRQEQPTATGERARDIAYALAVFNVAHSRNRDYLLRILNSCIAKPKGSPEDDICDGDLFDYLTNLYWRGDNELLGPLLRMADTRKDVIGEIGTFYANLLDRRPDAALKGIIDIPVETQNLICGLAAEDDLSTDGPKLERVNDHLKSANIETADRCLQAIGRETGRSAR